jgi:N-acetylglucosaminyldiphosphoundecaprenol N-acetyl-beta-D-mannosaminyltransferase
MKSKPAANSIFGVRIDRMNMEELIDSALSLLGDNGRHLIMYANVHVLNTAYRNRALANIINRADRVYADGAGTILGGKLLGLDLGSRITGADWIDPLCKRLARTEHSLFILAGDPGAAEEARDVLTARHNGLKVAGTHHGYFDKDRCDEVVDKINASGADLLFIGFGTPLQEQWVADNLDRLQPHLIWPVGALFDFVTGRMQRGPKLLLDHGFEWLARLIAEPGKLWRRYIIGNPLFILRVLKEKLLGQK